MTEEELKELFAKLDSRYVTKEEFENEVIRFTQSRYASKTDLLEAIGRVEAVIIEQSRSNELLTDMYTMTTKNVEQMARQSHTLENLAIELTKAKEHVGRRIWKSLPYLVRAMLTFASVWLTLIIATTMIGHQADVFMKENGLYVFFGNAALSLMASKDWKEK